ncbi:MAG: lytic transglycosylase domain-containing protein, partial [Casimicrobiaceae bacterium]
MGGAMNLLPDCMRPIAPPLPDVKTVDLGDGPDPFDGLPRWKQQIADLVDRLAPSYGIEPRLALAVIAVESNFDSRAVSIKDARGLMQLLPKTAARFRVHDAFDARDNVRGGLAYLRWLLAYYRGDVELAAAAYNAGEKAVDRYGGVPPYRETQVYVERVLRLFPSDYHPYDSSIVAPSAVAPPAAGDGK